MSIPEGDQTNIFELANDALRTFEEQGAKFVTFPENPEKGRFAKLYQVELGRTAVIQMVDWGVDGAPPQDADPGGQEISLYASLDPDIPSPGSQTRSTLRFAIFKSGLNLTRHELWTIDDNYEPDFKLEDIPSPATDEDLVELTALLNEINDFNCNFPEELDLSQIEMMRVPGFEDSYC